MGIWCAEAPQAEDVHSMDRASEAAIATAVLSMMGEQAIAPDFSLPVPNSEAASIWYPPKV